MLVTATAGPSNSTWWMCSNISTVCSTANQPKALAAIYYDKADTTKAPTSFAWNVPDAGNCANDDLSLPYYSIAAATPSTTKTMVIDYVINATVSFLWHLDGTSFRVNYNNPVLLLAEQGNLTYPDKWNVKNFGTNTTVCIVVHNTSPAAHPMHLHGHFVMQYSLDNSGVWPFHCHIAWHVSGGLYANLLETPADIGTDFSIPLIMQQTCTN